MSHGLTVIEFTKTLGVRWEKDRVKNVGKKIRPYLDRLVEFD